MKKKLIYGSDGVFYEKNLKTGEVRKLSPTFSNEFWEIYTVFSPEGIIYKIVGINRDGERCSYAQYSGLSSSIIYYEPAGRDLLCHDINSPDWRILSVCGGKLCDITSQLADNGEHMPLAVTYVEFKAPFLRLHVKGLRPYEKDCWFKQVESGYEPVSAETAANLMKW